MNELKTDITNYIMKNKRKIKIFTVLFICGLMLLKGVMQIPQINSNRDQIAQLSEQIEYETSRQEEIDELSGKVDSDEYVKKIASEKLGLVESNAKIFIDISQQQ